MPISFLQRTLRNSKRAPAFHQNNNRLVRDIALASACALLISGCSSASKHVNNRTKFSSKDYGVAASPRVTTSAVTRRGGGRSFVGKPYKVKGRWFYPQEDPFYDRSGKASWYGPNFHGRLTANGEVYNQYYLTAAHPTFPLPSYARVTNLKNGHYVTVRVNDRGPFAHGRIIDLSGRAADILNFKRAGTANVRVQYIGRAQLEANDETQLQASAGKLDQEQLLELASREQSQPQISTALAQPVQRPSRYIEPASLQPVPAIRSVQTGQTGDVLLLAAPQASEILE